MRPSLLLLLFACDGSDYPPPNRLPADLISCDEPEDCVVIELGCCDHCNGGVAVSARADRAAEVRETYAESCSPRTACTLMGCAPLDADCTDGECRTVTLPF